MKISIMCVEFSYEEEFCKRAKKGPLYIRTCSKPLKELGFLSTCILCIIVQSIEKKETGLCGCDFQSTVEKKSQSTCLQLGWDSNL